MDDHEEAAEMLALHPTTMNASVGQKKGSTIKFDYSQSWAGIKRYENVNTSIRELISWVK